MDKELEKRITDNINNQIKQLEEELINFIYERFEELYSKLKENK